MINRFRCTECGYVFPKPTRRKRCPECKAYGLIVNYPVYNIKDCPLCSHFVSNKTQHDENDEFCLLCDSHIATVRKCIIRSSYGAKLDVSRYKELTEER